jgi:hypothetical protein
MADPGLLQALDYILNQSDPGSIEVIAEAVTRKRRSLTMFSAIGNVPNPEKMAEKLTEEINAGLGAGIESMRNTVREMIVRIIREHAPELSPEQIDELSEAWLPADGGKTEALPVDVLLSMIEQFVAFSHGTMKKTTNEELRREMGAWPERYWKAFPPVVRNLITEYLRDKITEKEFRTRIGIAVGK